MQTDFLSNLPVEISTKIFCSHLDRESQVKCLVLNKKINALMSYDLLFNLNITPQENIKPYHQVMGIYKENCEYFCKKLPKTFKDLKCNTLLEANSVINDRLKRSGSWKQMSLLDEIWYVFMRQINYKDMCDISPKLTYDNSCQKDPSKEISILLRAGAKLNNGPGFCSSRNDLKYIISQDWCNENIIKLVLKSRNVIVTAEVAAIATKDPRYSRLLPLIFKSIGNYPNLSNGGEDYSLRQLLEGVSPSHESLLESYADKGFTVSPYNIRLALENKYSENFILKLLKKCPDGVDGYHLRLALERKSSEEFILKLLKVCIGGIDEYPRAIA